MTNHHDNSGWDLVIRPAAGWFDLHLRDLWRYRDLISLFVWRDFVSQFKQTILGPLWFLLQPLLTTAMQVVVFGSLAGLPTDGLPKMLFYMSGNVAWGYFAGCLTATSGTFVGNAAIFGKVYFPRLVSPLSVVISHLIKFALQLAMFLGFLIYFMMRGSTVQPNAAILLIPLLVLFMAGLGLGGGIIISSLTTKYRDLQQLVGFGIGLAMYASPVVLPVSALEHHRWGWLILANPMTSVIETFRYAFLGAGTVNVHHLLYTAGFTAVVLALGVVLFNHVERTFMDTV